MDIDVRGEFHFDNNLWHFRILSKANLTIFYSGKINSRKFTGVTGLLMMTLACYIIQHGSAV